VVYIDYEDPSDHEDLSLCNDLADMKPKVVVKEEVKEETVEQRAQRAKVRAEVQRIMALVRERLRLKRLGKNEPYWL
jgi:hypothetical protein